MELKQIYEISGLIARSFYAELTVEEQECLDQWLAASEVNRIKYERYRSELFLKEKLEFQKQHGVEEALYRFKKKEKQIRKLQIRRRLYAVAAVIVLPLLAGSLLLLRSENQKVEKEIIASPGTAGAVLVLNNGQEVQLKYKNEEEILKESNAQITVTGDAVSYHAVNDTLPLIEKVYNTIRTPRGGEYKVVLADGSYVYLNAGSSLRYPTTFSGDKREVYLSGEAWFEVAKNEKQPFYVLTDKLSIKVYGTAFNINSYNKEKTTVALAEGKVSLREVHTEKEYFLKPDQLAVYSQMTGKIAISDVDLTPYIAWKDGLFLFENEPLSEIMEKLILWYDIDVFYSNEALKSIQFTGYLKRYHDIGIILKALEKTTSVKFIQKGRTITIQN